MLTRPHRPPDETWTLPPHLRPHHSLRFHTPALTILTLAECPPNTIYPYACVVPSQHCLPSLRLRSALPTYSRHCLPSLCLECPPNMLPTQLILTLV
ncbi:hypothetical protein O181_119060 [Austropuccinia psidii MF-1]|uniref:Uncharacterized protein n=1 Tax=Austropuccinia psidii MF-1 TaxID=1389203 RepID=A0A9Q3KDB7_9BASI|nr:hypothetical protein [Austropuccinia psidii MF-1]